MIARLDDRSILTVSGAEARPFLQGLVTNDIQRLSPRNPLYAALLTPQGKILFDFLLFERDGAILVDCAGGSALAKRLSLYRLRAKVEIAERAELAVVAAWDGSGLPEPAADDPRSAALGRRAIVPGDALPPDASPAAAYRAHRLALGIPEGADFGQDRIFALDAGLEELHGVSFDKGCYVGQELTARMKHRGSARKRLLPVTAVGGGTLPAGGSLTADGSELGTVMSVYGAHGFALVRLDRLAQAVSPITIAGEPITVARPAWLFA